MEGRPLTAAALPAAPPRRRLLGLVPVRLTVVRSDAPAGRSRPMPWLLVLVLLGLALRCVHYFRDPPVWHDEAAQIFNVLHKDWSEALGPLYYSEACPPLFLLAEKAVVALLGDGTYALRLPPFLASCASFLLLIAVARRLLPRAGLVWFTLLLGTSDRLMWHTCEAKPYAIDVLIAAGLLAAFAWRSPTLRLRLALLASVSPVLVFLSFPACFLLGGAALALLPTVWRSRRPLDWSLYTVFGAALCGSFLLLHATAITAQKNDRIVECWQECFPDWGEPWRVPWSAGVRLSELCRYAAEPAGNVLMPLAAVGAVVLWRAGRRQLVGFLLAPVALNVFAWLLGSYPLEASRVVVYAAPAVLLLVAAGVVPVWQWLSRRARFAPLALAAVLLVPAGKTAAQFVHPWRRLDSATPCAFVIQQRRADEPVVGHLWEQRYYCRELGPMYRALLTLPTEPPSPAPAAPVGNEETPVESLWLLSTNDPREQLDHLAQLRPAATWRVEQAYRFKDVTVLHIRR
jgi:hypothetical protein